MARVKVTEWLLERGGRSLTVTDMTLDPRWPSCEARFRASLDVGEVTMYGKDAPEALLLLIDELRHRAHELERIVLELKSKERR